MLPFRFELNTMRLPFGDQIGYISRAVSEVNRVSTPRAVSSNQRLGLPRTDRLSATRRPSGESEALDGVPLSGSPTFEISLPDRSNHTNWGWPAPDPVR